MTQLLQAGHERASDPTASRPAVDEQTLGDHLAGPGGLTERSNTFDMRAVLQEFAAAAQAGALLGEVRDMASRFTARADVLATTRGEMTTAELTDIERRLIAATMGRASEHCCVVGERLTERSIAAADRELTAEQAKAVRAVTGSGHGVSVIEALAGTGKTYTAGVLREVYEAAGTHVIGVAPTGRAARELTEEAGIPARTLDRLLSELEKFDQTPATGVCGDPRRGGDGRNTRQRKTAATRRSGRARRSWRSATRGSWPRCRPAGGSAPSAAASARCA